MPQSDLFSKPGYLFRRAQQIAVAVFMDECRGQGVTPVQYAVLQALKSNPGLDQISLAQIVALDRSTLGDVATRLADRGLIHRHPGPEDRRTKLLYLSDRGEALLGQVDQAVERSQARILAPLSDDEGRALLSLLTKLVEGHRD